jgi:hypothetical protein
MGALMANHTARCVSGWRKAAGWSRMTKSMVQFAEKNGFKFYDPDLDNKVWPELCDPRWVLHPYTELIKFAFRPDWPHSHLIEILMLQIWDMQYRPHLVASSDSWAETSEKAATLYSQIIPFSHVAYSHIKTNHNFGRDIAQAILWLAP